MKANLPEAASTSALAGATVLQLIPALRDDMIGRMAIDVAFLLMQSGARAIIASAKGPLVERLRAFGGEWQPLKNASVNPLRLYRNTRFLREYISNERIDVIHAYSAGAAWSAAAAADKQPVWIVTSFPDRLPAATWLGNLFGRQLARADRMIAPSSFVSRAMIERYGILPERVKVIPRSIDVASFNREAVAYERIEYLQTLWNVSNSERIVFVPGRLVAENGQTTLIEAANLLIAGGERNIVFVLAGDARTDPKHVAALRERLSALGIDNFFRLAGPAPDMPAALAASDLVVVPAHTPPPLGRTVAEAQAIGRPVVTTTAGVLPENILCPPRMPDDLRTGWAVTPANAGELADAMATALALSPVEQESMAARARQFAEFMFSPQSVAESIRAVYTSLLSRDT